MDMLAGLTKKRGNRRQERRRPALVRGAAGLLRINRQDVPWRCLALCGRGDLAGVDRQRSGALPPQRPRATRRSGDLAGVRDEGTRLRRARARATHGAMASWAVAACFPATASAGPAGPQNARA
jgi:hypothetical protein